jgi:hypothetical protein
MANYYLKIRNPMDLGQIQAKLLMNEYDSVEDWKNDVKLVWTNAERFHGPYSCVGAVGAELRKRFTKMIDDESENSLKSWAARFRHVTTRLDILTRSAPPSISRYSQTSIQVPRVPKPHYRAIRNLIASSAQLTEAKDAQDMFRIIQQFAPGTPLMGKTMKMDLDRLPHVAFWAIERFVKKRFTELGKTYPQ